MNNRSIMRAPAGEPREIVIDGYLPNSGDYQEAAPGFQIDITWIRGALYRQRWLIAATITVALLLGLVATLLATPIYQAEAKIRVQPWGNFIVEGQNVSTPIGSAIEIDSFMQTQKEVVESRKLAEVVAEDLNLSSRSALLGPDIDALRPDNRSDEEWEADKLRMAAANLQARISANVPYDKQVVEISFASEDPALAAEITNAYADAFIQSDTQRNIESNTYAREYLEEQIEIFQARLQESERASNAFARNTGIVTAQTTGVDGEAGQTITGANLSSINQTVAGARARRIEAEQKWRAAEAIPAEQLPEVQANAVYQSLTAQRAELIGELSNLRQRYNDEFPEIVDLQARISLLDEQLAQTAENIKAGLRSEFIIAQSQEQALQGELAVATEDALVEQDQKVEFVGLEREADVLRARLTLLLDRYNAISTAANVQSGAMTLLDGATVPTSPVSPSLSRNMLIAVVLGIAFAGGLALVREVFVDQFRRAEDIEDRLNVPVLGITPFVNSNDIDPQDVNQFSALMEAYASIRSTVDVAVPRDGAVVQLTSSGASEGKSTTSLILAELFARLGRKTLLIDADIRKPSIMKLLETGPREAGLVEVLMGHATFDDAVIEGGHENLHVLSVAAVPPNPVELLSSGRFKEFIDEQRENYSIILIDSSPILGLADAPEIAQVVDSTIFVIEANRTSYNQAKTSLRRLAGVGANVIGAVLTKYRALDAGLDYNYQYQYYQYGADKK